VANQRFERVSLELLDRIVLAAVRPLSQAPSLKTFYDRGYMLLGVALGIVLLLLWLSGHLRQPISESSPIVQSLYKWTIAKIPLPGVTDPSSASLLFLPLSLYFLCFAFPHVRRPLGSAFSRYLAMIAHSAIGLGEWCLEHQWASAFIFVTLATMVVIGGNHIVDTMQARTTTERNFLFWLGSAEAFVDTSTMTRSESDRYGQFRQLWKPDVDRYLKEQTRYHPAICLHQILETLYSGDNDSQPWLTTLRLRASQLEASMAPCDQSHSLRHTLEADRAFALSHLLIGRIYAQLAEIDHSAASLNHALDHFTVVETETNTHLDDQAYQDYRAAAFNGEGTVYASATSIMLRETSQSSASMQSLASMCMNLHDCVTRSFASYESVNQDAGCTFTLRRSLNNTIDLLSRLGANYDRFKRLAPSAVAELSALSSPASLADTIETKVRSLLECSGKEPLIPVTFVTAAQAYSVAAQLRRQANIEWRPQAFRAGTYLRLASLLDASNMGTWDLTYMCPLYTTTDGKQFLLAGITPPGDSTPDDGGILSNLDWQCH